MKTKAYILTFISVILLAACKNNATTGSGSAEIDKITAQRDSLIKSSAAKDSSINAFVSSFAEIQNNLLSIKQKEEMLFFHTTKNIELSKGAKNEVNENIKIINELMEKNRRQITSLNAKLKDANYTITQLKGLVDLLVTSINIKNQDLVRLNKAMAENGKMDALSLNTAILNLNTQADSINKINARLNTAYYIIGDADFLKDKNIIIEKMGFFNPNQFKKLNPDFDKKDFIAIDTKQTKNIKIKSKTAKVLTNHPTDSYKLDGNNLAITDADKFWSESKFLVLLTD